MDNTTAELINYAAILASDDVHLFAFSRTEGTGVDVLIHTNSGESQYIATWNLA